MKEITESAIRGIKSLKQILSKKDYIDHVNLQAKNYIISKSFIDEFKDEIDPSIISKQNLNKKCILELCKLNLFNYEDWLNNIETKNIDIITDDEFVKKYNVDVNYILRKSRSISSLVFNRFFNTMQDAEAKLNLLIHADESWINESVIVNSANLLQGKIIEFKSIKDKLNMNDTELIKKLIPINKNIPLSLLLCVLENSYNRKYFEDNIMNIELDSSSLESRYSYTLETIVVVIEKIISKYPTSLIEKLMMLINGNFHIILVNKNLLNYLLCTCDDIGEEYLIKLKSCFKEAKCENLFISYCKSNNYTKLIADL